MLAGPMRRASWLGPPPAPADLEEDHERERIARDSLAGTGNCQPSRESLRRAHLLPVSKEERRYSRVMSSGAMCPRRMLENARQLPASRLSRLAFWPGASARAVLMRSGRETCQATFRHDR